MADSAVVTTISFVAGFLLTVAGKELLRLDAGWARSYRLLL
jgi:hypothetical protein